MKKITALIMMAIMITISGVYAAWIYDDAAPDAKTESALSVIVEAPETSGKSGTLDIGALVEVAIDDDLTDGTKYKAVLTCEGSITITFKPSETAGQDTKDNGIHIKLTPIVESTATFKVNGEDITIIKATGVVCSPAVNQSGDNLATEDEREVGTYVKSSDGTFVWTLSSSDILSLLQLGDPKKPFILDTSAKHAAFTAALAGHHNIKFRVEEVVK
jgi:hypothetical protein